MEIMGIAIVVIIISIVIVFVIRFAILQEPADYKKGFAQSEIATNLVNTMLSTTTDCRGMTFNELFQDCFEEFGDGGKTDCGLSIKSCSFAKEGVELIFLRTLDEWKYEYEFTVTREDTEYEIAPDSTCVSIERRAKTYPLPGNLEAKLAICG